MAPAHASLANGFTAPACITMHVRVIPPPATITPPVRAVVPAFVATLNVTVPSPEPEPPPVTASHATLVTAVQATFPVTAIDRPLHAALVRLVLAGLIPSAAAHPAWTTTQVRVIPPPATTTPPVRAVVPALVATLYVTVPLPEPELPAVTDSQAALVVAIQATFPCHRDRLSVRCRAG
jgi:hypothetical protein